MQQLHCVSTHTRLSIWRSQASARSQSKQVKLRVCRLCLRVSECDWWWKRTYAQLRRKSLAHDLTCLKQTTKHKQNLLVKSNFENAALGVK